MNAVRVDVTVDDALVGVAPALRPLLGRRVEVIALDVEPSPPPETSRRLSSAELLERRTVLPMEVGRLTEDDIERAILAGATDGCP